jgi:hypothetical protein
MTILWSQQGEKSLIANLFIRATKNENAFIND